MTQDELDYPGVQPEVNQTPLWKRVRNRWFRHEKPLQLKTVEDVLAVEHGTNENAFHEFLCERFFSRVEELEKLADKESNTTIQEEYQVYAITRRKQIHDYSNQYSEKPAIESYCILSDSPTGDEKAAVRIVLLKAVKDMDGPELTYARSLFNPGMIMGDDELTRFGKHVAASARYGHPVDQNVRNRALEVSKLRYNLGQKKHTLIQKGMVTSETDPIYDALVAKQILIERVRTGDYADFGIK